MTDNKPTEYISIPAAAVYLGMSVRAVERRLADGKLSRYKQGKSTVVSTAELDDLLNPPVVPVKKGGGYGKVRSSRLPDPAELYRLFDEGGPAHVAAERGVSVSTANKWLRSIPRPKKGKGPT